MAARAGHTDVVEFMLSLPNIEVNCLKGYSPTPLHLAADSGRVEVVQLLLKHAGIDINPRNYLQRTPLQLAIRSGHTKVVALLFYQRNVETCCHDIYKLSALLLAALHGHYNVAQALLDYEETSTINDTIIRTLEQRCVNPGEVMERVLEHSDFLTVDINSLDTTVGYGSIGFLSSAICRGERDVVQVLLNHKDIDVNLRSDYIADTTPLSLAVELGQTDVVKLLLQHEKINVNFGETSLFTRRRCPLQIAKEKGFSESVDLLIAKGAGDPGNPAPMHCNNHTTVFDLKTYESHVEYPAVEYPAVEYPAVYNSLL
jgi:ankyrin repeat protein